MSGAHTSLFFLSRFQAEVDRMFRQALELAQGGGGLGEWQPVLDIVETTAAVLVLAELPGFAAADLKIEVQGARVIISGTKVASLSGAGRFLCMERSSGRFSREIFLSWPVNSHQGKAHLEQGLLTIEFPKIKDQRQETRLIPIAEAPPAAEARV